MTCIESVNNSPAAVQPEYEENAEDEEETVTTKSRNIVKQIEHARKQANKGQEKQVTKMLSLNKKRIKNVKVNDLVLLGVPDVDRAHWILLICFDLFQKKNMNYLVQVQELEFQTNFLLLMVLKKTSSDWL